MSTPSIKVGQGNWGIKATRLLGYANTDKKFVAREFTVGRLLDTATRVNASGNIQIVNANIPRIDYFGGQASLLVEPSAVNLFQRSEEFNNAYWTSGNVTISANSTGTLDPFGGNNAELITKTSAVNTVAGISRSAPFSATGTHTLSVFIKSSVGNSVLLRMDSVNNTANTAFTFSTKTFSNSGANFISSSFQEFSNGWFRLSLTASVQSTVWNVDVIQLFSNQTNDAFWIFGAQLEANSVPTSYIPTTTGSVTRNADVISVTGVAGLIGQTEGTAYIEVDFTQGFTRGAYILTLRSSNSVYALLAIRNNGYLGFQVSNTIPTVDLGNAPGGQLSNAVFKIAFAYKSGDYALYVNGNQVGTSASTGVPTPLNEIRFSSEGTLGNDPLQGRVRALELYQTRLPNTTTDGSPSLQSITTL